MYPHPMDVRGSVASWLSSLGHHAMADLPDTPAGSRAYLREHLLTAVGDFDIRLGVSLQVVTHGFGIIFSALRPDGLVPCLETLRSLCQDQSDTVPPGCG